MHAQRMEQKLPQQNLSRSEKEKFINGETNFNSYS